MDKETLQQKLEELVEPLLEERGVMLVDLALHGRPGRYLLQIFVDLPGGGITLGLLKQLTRDISTFLDVEDPIPGSYTLEVSSPGLDRVLQRDREFRWAQGRRIRVVLRSGETLVGTLVRYEDQTLYVAGEGTTRAIARDDVARARLSEPVMEKGE
ncbi:MAG: ribosome maturation factor RimP [Candidatus Hydrothermae bacterium]|nr:ribosome maturation factor RimP [Candidatus Hydrothermae bacterium]